MRHVGKVQAALAVVLTGGFFTVIWFALTHEHQPSMRDVVLMLIGALVRDQGTVANFYFGSSSGSVMKTNLLAGKDAGDPPPGTDPREAAR